MPLYSLHGHQRPPTLEESAALLGLSVAALDRDFGVILLDPVKRVYGVKVKNTIDPEYPASHPEVGGPWADPPIAPFAPRPPSPRRPDEPGASAQAD